jgi:hypothetical protein
MKASKSDSQLLLGCIAGLSIIFNIARKIYIIYNNFINNKEVNTSLLFSFAISQTHFACIIILINSNTDYKKGQLPTQSKCRFFSTTLC